MPEFTPVINVTSLNGANGFRLDGDAAGDASGHAGAAGGDINGDGLAASLIGAPWSGRGGNDALNAGAGSDNLDGGVGNDVLVGGTGADSFAFHQPLNARTNVDRINHFVVVDHRIILNNAVFVGLVEGTLTAGAFNTGAAASEADDRIIYNTATGDLIFDSNGNAAGGATRFADIISLTGRLANTNFVVV